MAQEGLARCPPAPHDRAMSEPSSIRPDVLESLFRLGDEAREEFRGVVKHRHHLFIPCDYSDAYEALRGLVGRAHSFVELGSGSGVVTILADLLGLEACGIEAEPWLVERSRQIAEEFDSGAVFAEGTFVPLEYEEEIINLSDESLTPMIGADGFEELGIELSEFDLVFAYPWPGDEEWLFELIRRYARNDVLLLTYGNRDGFHVLEGAEL